MTKLTRHLVKSVAAGLLLANVAVLGAGAASASANASSSGPASAAASHQASDHRAVGLPSAPRPESRATHARHSSGPELEVGIGTSHTRHARVMIRPDAKPSDDKVENDSTLPAPSTISNDYLYNQKNGVVQTAPHVYLILWGNWSSAADTKGIYNRLYWFYKGLGGSNFGNVLTQYHQGCTAGTWTCTGAAAGNQANILSGVWNDTSAVPTTPSQAQMDAEAARAANAYGDYSYNAQYVVALPSGHGDYQFAAKGGDACAWHDWVSAGGKWVTYTSLPYMTDYPRCYANYANAGSAGSLDGVTMVAGHEYAESVTDPGLNAWYDKYGAENGDKCSAWGANVTLANGYSFPVQPTWSNWHRYYKGSGCVYNW